MEHHGKATPRTLSLLQFSAMIFIMMCAGPYGLEYLVQSGGPLYTLIALCIVPFLFSLPQSLMCAELNSAMPCNHGYIVWVFRGLGEFWGFVNALNCIVASCIDLPLFPVLMVQYFSALFVSNQDSFSSFAIYMIKFALVFIAMILNIFNIKIIGTITIVISFVIVTPFLVGFIAAIPNIDPNQWNDPNAVNEHMTYNWAVFISSCLWLHCGFDKLSCVTGETKFQYKNFFVPFVLAIILAWCTYTLPLMGALTVSYSNTDWDKGYLLQAYDEILPGIKYFVLLGGVLNAFSLYIVELSAAARAICAVAQPYIVITNKGKILMMDDANYKQEIMKLQKFDIELRDESNIEDSDPEHPHFIDDDPSTFTDEDEDRLFVPNAHRYRKMRVGIFPSWIGHYWKRTGAPVRAVVLISILNCFLIAVSFEILIQITIFFSALTWLVEFAAFMKLKYSEPMIVRPFEVPFGLFGAWLITVIKIMLVLVVVGITSYYDFKILLVAAAYNVIVMIAYGIRSYYWQSKKVKFTVH